MGTRTILSALVGGLALSWAALAMADGPPPGPPAPAAPIFYCPAPPPAAPHRTAPAVRRRHGCHCRQWARNEAPMTPGPPGPPGPPPPPEDGRIRFAPGGDHYGYLYDNDQWEGRFEGGGFDLDRAWRDGGAWGWAGHGFRAGDGQWRDGSYGEVVEYTGRDAHGFLVWPGKTWPTDAPAAN